jgi:hypothetical protein
MKTYSITHINPDEPPELIQADRLDYNPGLAVFKRGADVICLIPLAPGMVIREVEPPKMVQYLDLETGEHGEFVRGSKEDLEHFRKHFGKPVRRTVKPLDAVGLPTNATQGKISQ